MTSLPSVHHLHVRDPNDHTDYQDIEEKLSIPDKMQSKRSRKVMEIIQNSTVMQQSDREYLRATKPTFDGVENIDLSKYGSPSKVR